jgi:hypothetical protein
MSDYPEDLSVAYFNAGFKAAGDSATLERERIVKLLKHLVSELVKEATRLHEKGETAWATKAAHKAIATSEAIDLITAGVEDE